MDDSSVAARRLFHVSDQPGIARFDPRPPPSLDAGVTAPAVWAIDARLLHNYLLPRDCPRVTFYPTATTTPADVERLLSGTTARHVVAIEAAWFDRVRDGHLWLYEFAPDSFVSVDAGAGYFVSRHAVAPLSVTPLHDLLGALLARGVELRVLPSLWKLRDAVHASTLAFSFIRMRHARPRAADGGPVPLSSA